MSDLQPSLFIPNPAAVIDAMLSSFTPAKARRSDPQTSHDAASTWKPAKATRVELFVYRYFLEFQRGTDGEMEEWIRDRYPREHFAPSSLRKRRGDLVDKGVLRDSEVKAVTHGSKMIVWELAGSQI